MELRESALSDVHAWIRRRFAPRGVHWTKHPTRLDRDLCPEGMGRRGLRREEFGGRAGRRVSCARSRTPAGRFRRPRGLLCAVAPCAQAGFASDLFGRGGHSTSCTHDSPDRRRCSTTLRRLRRERPEDDCSPSGRSLRCNASSGEEPQQPQTLPSVQGVCGRVRNICSATEKDCPPSADVSGRASGRRCPSPLPRVSAEAEPARYRREQMSRA